MAQEYAPDSPMTDFLDTNLAKVTKLQYICRLKMFFDSLELQGSLDRQSKDFLAQVKKGRGREWAQNGLKYFIRDKKKKAEAGELAESTIRNFYKPVRLFCSVHDIELSWKKITNTIPTGRKFANDRAPTKEEILKIIEYPDRRIKPLVLTMCSSGIRLGAWEYLKWKHIEPIRRDDRIVAAKIIVYAGENEQYFSFITPEAFEALEEWMEYRRISGEDINGESWIMRTVWDTTNPKSTTVKFPKKMSREAIINLVKRALKSEGLRTNLPPTRRYEFKANHGFRKFFQTNAEPKMKSLDVMTLMGQDTGRDNKPTVEMLLDEYLKAVDNLIINKTNQQEEIVRNQQVLAAEMQTKDQQMQTLRNEILETQQKKDQEILELKEQMNKMQHDFKSYDQMVKATLEHSKELISEKIEKDRKREKAEDERRRILYDMLDMELPGWKKKYFPLIGLESKPLTKEARKKIEGFLEQLKNAPDSEDYYDED